MNLTLHIPESIARSLRLPEAEAEQRLLQELASALYSRGILSFGKAAELAGVNRLAFAEVLTKRGVPRHYTDEELAEDLKYASGESHVTRLKSGIRRSAQPASRAIGRVLRSAGGGKGAAPDFPSSSPRTGRASQTARTASIAPCFGQEVDRPAPTRASCRRGQSHRTGARSPCEVSADR